MGTSSSAYELKLTLCIGDNLWWFLELYLLTEERILVSLLGSCCSIPGNAAATRRNNWKDKYKIILNFNLTNTAFIDSLVVGCWLWVLGVPGSIPSQGPCHTKDIIKMVPVSPLLNTQHYKGEHRLFPQT